MDILLETLEQQGYDVKYPERLDLRAPETVQEVHRMVDNLKEVEYDEDSDVRILLSTLIGELISRTRVVIGSLTVMQVQLDLQSSSLYLNTGTRSSNWV